MVAASAPGKLILMGEHGAVYGLPALSAALGLRARATLAPAPRGRVELDLPGVGYRGHAGWPELREHAARARRCWRSFMDGAAFERDDHPAALVRVALGEALAAAGAREPEPLRLRVVSELPVGAGFGSSAAVAVAVIAGLLAWCGTEPEPDRVERLALEVERRQHGRPSGVDHGTVLRGGVLWASRDPDGGLSLRPVAARADSLRRFGIFDTGAPAETTGAVVAAVAETRRRDPEGFAALLARMETATGAFRSALEDGGGEAAPVREFERCLERLGVVPPPVRRAIRRVERAGGAAKISGAGALTGEAAGCLLSWGEHAAAWEAELAGYRRLDCAMGAPGLEVESA